MTYTGSNVTGTAGIVAVDKVGNKVRFYDPQSLRETGSFDAPEPCAHELAISHDHKTAYVPLYGDGIYGANKKPNNKILIVDLVSQKLADVISLGEYAAPHGMVATAQGKLWVVCDIAQKLLLVDPAQHTVEAAYDCPAKGPHIVVLTPDEKKLYVSSKEGDLAAFDITQRKFIASVPMRAPGITSGNGSGSEGLTPTPDGKRLVVLDNDRNDLHVIDIAADREIDRIPLAQNPPSNVKRSRLAKLMFSPDGKHLVATVYAGGLAWLIDAADFRRQTPVPVAKGPQGIAFAPDGKTVLVSSHDSGLLTQISLADARIVASHDGGAGIEVLTYY
jgi:DNA-binding beta-propeller fold protein YncE